ncbi:hypothetical protein [Acidisphaera sp. L21]|uniref:hypothetical protein n=1 Tax=Acidisphaera sp. L21 TaxID=1641851 RepID=UPI00131C2443|nr:hypothetical protein [Acidisphaera sp. L21]
MGSLPWLVLLGRAMATAILVMCASALGESLGPFWGAFIASVPVSTGPTYLFLAMQHDASFVAASALASCAANASTGLFLLVYGRLVRRSASWAPLGLALLAWFAASLAIQRIAWTPVTALAVNIVVFGGGFALLGTTPPPGATAPGSVRRRWFDLPLRGAAVGAFVLTVLTISTVLGPQATGIIAVFPISLTSLIVILQPRIGGVATSLLAANALRAMLGFGVMLLVLHLAIPPLGIAAALIAALIVSVGWSAGLLGLRRLRLA